VSSFSLVAEIIGDKQRAGVDLPASHRQVLLALANHANREQRAFPGNALIAYEARLSERQVTRTLKCLESCTICGSPPERPCGNPMGIIVATAYRNGGRMGSGTGLATEWELRLDRAPKLPLFETVVERKRAERAAKLAKKRGLAPATKPDTVSSLVRPQVRHPDVCTKPDTVSDQARHLADQVRHLCVRQVRHPCVTPSVFNSNNQGGGAPESGPPLEGEALRPYFAQMRSAIGMKAEGSA
jgi:hypothetical protein